MPVGIPRGVEWRWSMERVEQELRAICEHLGRMPSNNELVAMGRNPLAVAITRRGGFRAWAARLGFGLKGTETHRGMEVQETLASWLEAHGFAVEKQTTRAPFDLLVNGIRVDVKSARYGEYLNRHNGTWVRGYVFALNKVPATCDVYALCGVDDRNQIMFRYFVPAADAQVRTITLTAHGKYDRFREALAMLRPPPG